MAQTSISRQAVAVPGLLADNTRAKDCLTAASEEASAQIPFGVMVKRGTADSGVLKLTSTSDVLAGITVFGQSYSHATTFALEDVGTTGLQPGCILNILNKGTIYVPVEEDVTPADRVFVRAIATTGEVAGAFRASVDTDALVVADFTFTASASTDLATATAHGLITGDGPLQVSNSGGALPSGLSAATDYWVIRNDANTFYFATSQANALTGTHIDLTTNGTGTQTASDTVSTARVATIEITDYAKFRRSASSGDLAVVEINMRVSRAVDAV